MWKKISLGLFSWLLAAIVSTAALNTGCAAHAYYDPYYHDYHPVEGEAVYYSQWERDTHRDHVDLNKRNDADKKQYWDWRHKDDHH
jgi:hypothetical protein